MPNYSIVQCSYERHGAQILEILNEAIETSTALYDYKPRSMENMVAWFAAKSAGNFPVIGLEVEPGELLGFASFGTFRAFPAYKYTAEHSIYVHKDHRGHGYANILLTEIIASAKRSDLHVLIGAIDAANSASIALHEKFGFKHVGTLPQVGFKFGDWLDLALYQLIFDTPAKPTDG
ncbi:MAG: N-acetyltransferase family protein [Rhodoluna sp.]